jgi:perosamine synthetase
LKTKIKPRIPHSLPALGTTEARAAAQTVKSGFVGYGPRARELERRLHKRTGRRFAFVLPSGWHALVLALKALDLPRGSVIALPVLTCGSVLSAVVNAGHLAFLTDINDHNLTMDVRVFPKSCAAIIAPHAYGAPVDVSAIRKAGVPWIEDCATSPATVVKKRNAGTWGTFSIFSFASTKYLAAGAGGALLTDDPDLASRIEELLDIDSLLKEANWRNGFPGAQPGRLSDVHASLALIQLDRLAEFAAKRKTIAGHYNKAFRHLCGLRVPGGIAGHSFYRYILKTSNTAENLVECLQKDGIDARSSVNPWLNDCSSKVCAVAGGPWPVAEGWRDHLLSLPIHPDLSTSQVKFIIKSVERAVRAEAGD